MGHSVRRLWGVNLRKFVWLSQISFGISLILQFISFQETFEDLYETSIAYFPPHWTPFAVSIPVRL